VCVCVRGWLRSFPPGGSGGAQVPQTPHTHNYLVHSNLFFFSFFPFLLSTFLLRKKTDKQTKLFFYFLLTWIYFVLISLSFSLGQMSFTSYLIWIFIEDRHTQKRVSIRLGGTNKNGPMTAWPRRIKFLCFWFWLISSPESCSHGPAFSLSVPE
jgi:hypothetical protein